LQIVGTILAVFIGVGLAAVVGFLVFQAVRSSRFHRKAADDPVLLRTPVVVRHYQSAPWRTWSRPYGDSVGSRQLDLVIRNNSIEVSYVGRPAGGIGGIQWFLVPRRTTIEALDSGGPDSLLPGRGVLLVEVDERGKEATRLALDVDATYDDVWRTLLATGVHEGGS
jgi:hypothetical protein